jgi:NAD(P)-dependent dehydrogenase (short-subunit alcohol dehydrogenase family)
MALAQHGATVVVSARNETRLNRLVETIRSTGGDAIGVTGDISSLDGARGIVEATTQAVGRVDVLVNCAGGLPSEPLLAMTVEEWDGVITQELHGAFYCVKAAAEHMVSRGEGGAIISVAGGAGIYGIVGESAHAAAKGGLIAGSWGWAEELRQYGIRVNCVRGGVRSNAMDRAVTNVRPNGSAATPRDLGFFEPEEAAPLVVWLASAAAKEVTGRYFGIDGPRLTLWEPKAPDTEVWAFPAWTPDSLADSVQPLLRRRPPMMKVGDLLVTSVGRVQFEVDRW